MLIGDGDAEEYVNTIEKTKALLSAQQKKTEKMVLERVRSMANELQRKCNHADGLIDGVTALHELLSKLSEMEEHE